VLDPDAAANDQPRKARAAVASTFVAGSEFAREGALRLEQGEDFAIVRMAVGVAVPLILRLYQVGGRLRGCT
jgi:hypothetical protein